MNRSEPNTHTGQPLWPELVVLLVMAVLFTMNATTFAIDPYSEIFHLVSAKESLAAGRFWTPVLDGQDYLLRAPLWTCVVITFFKVMGTTLWAARLPAVICALAGLALTYGVTVKLTKNRFAALFAASVLGSTWGYFRLATLSSADVLVTDLILLFALLFLQWYGIAMRRSCLPVEMKIYSGLLGGTLGLLLLAQGPLSVAAAVAIGVSYLLLNNRLELTRRLSGLYVVAPLILIPLPWLLWTSITSHNLLFFMDYLLFQPANRFLALGPWQGLRADPLFYLKQMSVGFLPYIFLLPALLLDREPANHLRRDVSDMRVINQWLLIWLLLGLVFCSISAFQAPGLILPFYPPLAMLVGAYLGNAAEAAVGSKTLLNTLSAYVLLLMVSAVLMTILIFQVLPADYVAGIWHGPGQPLISAFEFHGKSLPLEEPIPLWKLWLLPGPFILLLGGIVLYALQLLRRTPTSLIVLVSTFVAFLLYVKAVALPMLSRPVPRMMAQVINEQAGPQDQIVLYSLHPDIKRVLFYLSPDKLSRVRVVRSSETLTRTIADGKGSVFGIIREPSFFNDLDYKDRQLLRVTMQDWTWDMDRLWELRRFLGARLPRFERMKSTLLVFKSLPGNAFSELQEAFLISPANAPSSKKKKRR